MIKIIDGSLRRLGVVKNAVDAVRTEEINGENTLDFTAVLDNKLNTLITENTMFELNDDYFDTALLRKSSNDDGTYTVEIEAEHVSYRLNDPQYNVESFLGNNNPSYVIGQILQGTGFSAGTVEIAAAPIYDIREARSRRKLLMDYIDHINCEVIFRKFIVDVVKKRGDQTAKVAVKDNNVKVIAKEVNKRKFDADGNPLVSYTCQPINLPNDSYVLGDAVTLIERNINIREALRVVRISYNPYIPTEAELTFGTYINGFEAPIYDIKNETLDAGLSDEEVAQIANDAVDEAIKTLPLSDLMTTYIYSDTGVFSNAIVKRLRTDLSKPWLYLAKNTSDVHYQDIGDTDIATGRYFEVDYCLPDLPPVQYTVPSLSSGYGSTPLWWYEGNVGAGLTTSEEHSKNSEGNPQPVMVYQYETGVQHRIELKKTPEGWWGVRSQWGNGVDSYGRGSGIIEKTGQYMQMIMDPGVGEEIGGWRVSVTEGPEYYDTELKMWRKPGSGSSDINELIDEILSDDEFIDNLAELLGERLENFTGSGSEVVIERLI